MGAVEAQTFSATQPFDLVSAIHRTHKQINMLTKQIDGIHYNIQLLAAIISTDLSTNWHAMA